MVRALKWPHVVTSVQWKHKLEYQLRNRSQVSSRTISAFREPFEKEGSWEIPGDNENMNVIKFIFAGSKSISLDTLIKVGCERMLTTHEHMRVADEKSLQHRRWSITP